MQSVTGISVVYNTPHLLDRAVSSIREFYPELPLIIANNSTDGHHYRYKDSAIFKMEGNTGHGPGLHYALQRTKTKYALLFDSDIEMFAPPIEKMVANLVLPKEKVYGVGRIVFVNDKGQNVKEGGIPYLHPHFALIDVELYHRYERFINHGAPWIRTMKQLYGLAWSSLVDFPVHEFINHEGRGTRKLGNKDWLQNWEKP